MRWCCKLSGRMTIVLISTYSVVRWVWLAWWCPREMHSCRGDCITSKTSHICIGGNDIIDYSFFGE